MKQGSSFAKKQGTLIALACAAAFAAPQAMAQVATPDFSSGKGLTLSVDFLLAIASKNGNGSSAGAASDTVRRTELSSSSSSVYFKGSEKLGGSFLQGWGFVITWDFDGDEYNRRGANEVSVTVLGLQTTAGAFFVGVMDNPYKQIGSLFTGASSTYGPGLSQSAVLGNPGFRSGTAKGSFDGDAESTPQQGNVTRTMSFYRLNANSINWYSPDWNGFKAYAQWVPGDSQVPAGVTERDPRIIGLGATYNNGPFAIGYAYEHHRDSGWGGALTAGAFGGTGTGGVGQANAFSASTAAGLGTHDTSIGQVLGMAYTFGNFRVSGFYQRMEYDQSGGTAFLTNMSVDSWYLGLRWRSGPHEIAGQFATADNYDCNAAAAVATCRTGVGDTGMQHYGIGYRYSVSKQLRLFASAARMDNDRYGAYTGHSGAPNVGLGTTNGSNMAGSKYTNFAVGAVGSF